MCELATISLSDRPEMSEGRLKEKIKLYEGRTMIEFTIPGTLPGINEYTRACRQNKYTGAKMKKNAQADIEWEIRKVRPEKAAIPVILNCDFYEPNRRRDKDNICAFAHKVILDALVCQQVIPDDGWDEVLGFNDEFHVDKKNPRIEVSLIERGHKLYVDE